MVIDRDKEICERCGGAGRVVDDSQAGEPVATCMACKGNGWVYANQRPKQANSAWLGTPRPARDTP